MLSLRTKVFGYIIDFIGARISLGYPNYVLYLKLMNKSDFDTILFSNSPEDSKRLLYSLHQLHRMFGISAKISDSLGYPCNISKIRSVPAKTIRKKYLEVGLKHINKSYCSAEDLNIRRDRVVKLFEDKYLGGLYDFEIDGSIAYLTTICLVATTGCVFKSAVYKECVKTILKSIQSAEFENNNLNTKQIKDMIYISSSLLPNQELQENFIVAVESFLVAYETNLPHVIAELCFTNLITKTKGFNHE
jgi:hypothetical protein